MREIKCVVGIDVAKDKLDASIQWLDGEIRSKRGTTEFPNTEAGCYELEAWVKVQTSSKKQDYVIPQIKYIVESTGVYHEELCWHIYGRYQSEAVQKESNIGKVGKDVSQIVTVHLINPRIIKDFIRSLGVYSKTDKLDAYAISTFGIERSPISWAPSSPIILSLRRLMRLRGMYVAHRATYKCQLHSAEKSHEYGEFGLEKLRKSIADADIEIRDIDKKIQELAKTDASFYKKYKQIQTIPGVGPTVAMVVITETGGFIGFTNSKQLARYSGLDVIENSSGKHKGKTRISKCGNARIRAAVYMGSLDGAHQGSVFYKYFTNICSRNPKYKQIALVAISRKLLVIMLALWKKDEEFNKDYKWAERNKDSKPD